MTTIQSYNDLLKEGLLYWGIDIDQKKLKQFEIYLSLLVEWNGRFNLTAITDPREITIQHFLDSLSILKVDASYDNANLLDMGTGAGFPGIPIKIMYPDINLTLVDSVKKKTIFLNEVVTQLGLINTEVIHARAEDLARDTRKREFYDMVVSRAVAEMRVLSEYCLPFVKENGIFISYKGPAVFDEMDKAQRAIKVLGGANTEIIHVDIPLSPKTHHLVLVKKLAKTPKNYPRSTGKPKKSPL